jgi:hypothetical protein
MKRLEKRVKLQGKPSEETINFLTEQQQKSIFQKQDLTSVLQDLEREETLGEVGENTVKLLDLLFQQYEKSKSQFTIQSLGFWFGSICSILKNEKCNWFGASVLAITGVAIQAMRLPQPIRWILVSIIFIIISIILTMGSVICALLVPLGL